MNGLLVAYVGTLPLRVMQGSSLMVCDGPSVCAVVEIGEIPLERGCVIAWLVCGGAVAFGGSFQRVQGCFLALCCSTAIVDDSCSTAFVDESWELFLLASLIEACRQPLFVSALFDIGI